MGVGSRRSTSPTFSPFTKTSQPIHWWRKLSPLLQFGLFLRHPQGPTLEGLGGSAVRDIQEGHAGAILVPTEEAQLHQAGRRRRDFKEVQGHLRGRQDELFQVLELLGLIHHLVEQELTLESLDLGQMGEEEHQGTSTRGARFPTFRTPRATLVLFFEDLEIDPLARLFASHLAEGAEGADHPPALADDAAPILGLGMDEDIAGAALFLHLNAQGLGVVQEGCEDIAKEGFQVHGDSRGRLQS